MSKRLIIRVLVGIVAVGVVAAIVISVSRPGDAMGMGVPPANKMPSMANQTAPTPMAAQSVTAAAPTAVPTQSVRTIRATGYLLAANQVSLSFQTSGILRDVKAKEGSQVKSGDTLAKLDTTSLDLQVVSSQTALTLQEINLNKVKSGPTVEEIAIAKSNLDKAKSSLDQAQAAFDRVGGDSNPMIAMSSQSVNLQTATSNYQAAEATYKQTIGHPTDSELATAQTQYDQAKAALAIAKQNLANAVILAPFDGTVLSVKPQAGELVSQGSVVMTIADLTHMQAQANLDENTLATIQVGQTAKLSLDAFPGKSLTGRVSKIALTGTTTGGVVSVPVTLDIDATDVRIYPGLSATIEFKTN